MIPTTTTIEFRMPVGNYPCKLTLTGGKRTAGEFHLSWPARVINFIKKTGRRLPDKVTGVTITFEHGPNYSMKPEVKNVSGSTVLTDKTWTHIADSLIWNQVFPRGVNQDNWVRAKIIEHLSDMWKVHAAKFPPAKQANGKAK